MACLLVAVSYKSCSQILRVMINFSFPQVQYPQLRKSHAGSMHIALAHGGQESQVAFVALAAAARRLDFSGRTAFALLRSKRAGWDERFIFDMLANVR